MGVKQAGSHMNLLVWTTTSDCVIHSPVALTDDHTVSDTEGNKDGLLVLYTHHDMFESFLFVF